ncbi:MAG: hypothetical protein RSD87_11095, partial [Cellulosilyticaceae bacterium]
NIYEYTGNTLILDRNGNKLDNIHLVNTYDVLELAGVGTDVYSIKVLSTQGAIQFDGLPEVSGRIEIDINR